MRSFAWLLMLVGAMMVGCGPAPSESEPEVTSTSGDADTGHEDHAHDEHSDHDHGDHDHEDHEHADEATGAEGHDDQTSTGIAEKVRFVADKKLSVPEMMCPYSCWPRVQETLAAQPGVEGVQLAEQPEGTPEGEIKERVVELKLSGDFDADAAIAALKNISFDAEVLN